MMTRTFVVGTAGHVDHGKSSLVRALTGVDPDRLAEEQLRHMTIDLGFAEFTTPAGNRVHLVDVPGHERFVRNMLAGASGIDAALLTIAADDGPMPQTREHLAILDLLGIEHGVVALTKADLVDAEWCAFVAESIRELLQDTALATAVIVPVSSITGNGLAELRAALDRALISIERNGAAINPRLPIDRVFSASGFGTVVTGTLQDASLHIGDRVTILPGDYSSRVRGLQTFGEVVETAQPGSRVAVNLVGLETNELVRGDVLTVPGAITPAMRLDVRMQLLHSSDRPLQHNDEVVLFVGSSETPAKAALLDREAIEPGDAGWVQLRLSRPVVVLPRDRFIVRRPSPAETIGGGIILELDAPRHKRFQPIVLDRLEQLLAGDPADVLLAWLGDRFMNETELRMQTSNETIDQLLADGRILHAGEAGGRMLASARLFEQTERRLNDLVDAHHTAHPLESGIGRAILRQETGLPRSVFDLLLMNSDRLEETHARVRRIGFRIELDPDQHRIIDGYLAAIRIAGFQPPTPDEAAIPDELTRAMIEMEIVVAVGDGIVFLPQQIEQAQSILLDTLTKESSISLAEYRDLLGTTRKYTQALLEYFDQQRVTRRIGDRRVAYRSIEQRVGDSSA